MAQRGHHLILLLIWLATWLTLARRETRYEKFLRQHVDYPKSSARDSRTYCNQMMQRRGMTSEACKITNTFIHASDTTITTVCGSGGTPASGDLRDSIASFALTTCRLQGRSETPPCNYNADTSTQRIRIACVGVDPVHYNKSI